MIRVLIVDDDNEVAIALKRNIDGRNMISVIGIASNGKQAVDLCGQLHPDIVLMDIRMPVMDGITASKLIKEKHPLIKIIMLTLFKDEDQIFHSVRGECDGYLFKGNRSEKIIGVIVNVYNGFSTFERGAQTIIRDQMKDELDDRIKSAKLNMLTKREIEIVRLMTAGKNNIEIAKQLHFSEGYIRNQLVVIREKLNLRNSLELVAWGGKIRLMILKTSTVFK